MGSEHNYIIRGEPEKNVVSIHIGEYFASRQPFVITTFLGSCVAACLYDWKNNIGGMNHILVPGKARMNEFNALARFSINAMELLINAMMSLGADRGKIYAKLFGGANVIPGLSEDNPIGLKNARFVADFLKNERIPIESKDLGGFKSRRIFFHTDTGAVYVKRSHSMKSSRLADLERRKLEDIAKQLEKPTDVTLFDSSD